ncbi:Bestrophin/UPF0187, partial [Thamnocephalis sphaerospora]
LRWRGSVLQHIWWKVIGFAAWAAIWTALYQVVPVRLNIPTLVIQVIGMVLSLLLVFRTNTAYDRFWEGRRIWGNTVLNVRNLTRFIWVGVLEKTPRDAIEKRSAINLLVAFAVATKHYLRAEYGADYPDLRDYLTHIPKYSYADGTATRPSNLPLEISIYLTSYIHHQKINANIDPGQFTIMSNALSALVDCLTGFERILRTPIPLAYSIHLAQSVWVYCLALPFQLVKDLGWVTIPVVAATAFTMFGIQSIGEEIENPFGYDANDLPLDDFCKVIKSEV